MGDSMADQWDYELEDGKSPWIAGVVIAFSLDILSLASLTGGLGVSRLQVDQRLAARMDRLVASSRCFEAEVMS